MHGLATAYYLAANHGITDVAVLDKGYLGGGGSGRNTAILRSNYLTPEGVRFYDRSLQLYRHLATDLELQRDVLPARPSDAGPQRQLAAHDALAGRGQQARRASTPRSSARPRSSGWSPSWNLSRAPATRSSARSTIRRAGSSATTPSSGDTRAARRPRRPASTRTPRSPASTWPMRPGDGRAHHPRRHRHPGRGQRHRRVVHADLRHGRRGPADHDVPAAGRGHRAGEAVPVTVIVSGTLHVYVSQTDRGELVFGASVDPFTSYSMRGSLEFIEGLAGHVLELMPALTKMRLLRQWAGLCDMTPDFSPIMGPTPVGGFLRRRGLGHLRVQGRAGVRRGHGGAASPGQSPRRSSPPSAWTGSPKAAGRREGRGRGRPLTGHWLPAPAPPRPGNSEGTL